MINLANPTLTSCPQSNTARARCRLDSDSPNHLPEEYWHTLRRYTNLDEPAGSLSDWPFCQLAVRKCADTDIRTSGIFGWHNGSGGRPGKGDGQANNS